MTTLGGTEFAKALHECYRSGLQIGGTSAGASAMSTVMIARGHGRSAPRLASVRLSPGLGILRRVIVDQHFQERDRIGRLMAAVLRKSEVAYESRMWVSRRLNMAPGMTRRLRSIARSANAVPVSPRLGGISTKA